MSAKWLLIMGLLAMVAASAIAMDTETEFEGSDLAEVDDVSPSMGFDATVDVEESSADENDDEESAPADDEDVEESDSADESAEATESADEESSDADEDVEESDEAEEGDEDMLPHEEAIAEDAVPQDDIEDEEYSTPADLAEVDVDGDEVSSPAEESMSEVTALVDETCAEDSSHPICAKREAMPAGTFEHAMHTSKYYGTSLRYVAKRWRHRRAQLSRRYHRLYNKYLRHTKAYFGKKIRILADHYRKLGHHKDALKKAINDLVSKMGKNNSMIGRLRAQMRDAHIQLMRMRELADRIAKHKADLERKLADVQANTARLQRAHDASIAEHKRLQQAHATLQGDYHKLVERSARHLAAANQRIRDLSDFFIKITAKNAAAQASLNACNQNHAAHRARLQAQINHWNRNT